MMLVEYMSSGRVRHDIFSDAFKDKTDGSDPVKPSEKLQ